MKRSGLAAFNFASTFASSAMTSTPLAWSVTSRGWAAPHGLLLALPAEAAVDVELSAAEVDPRGASFNFGGPVAPVEMGAAASSGGASGRASFSIWSAHADWRKQEEIGDVWP